MASKATKAFATGMKIMGGGNVPTYTLEFLTPSGKHKKGSYMTIAVPYAKLGRSGNCTVQFGEESETVSREHAAIERSGDDVYIVNLSSTNPTLVNGRPVRKKYYLNNGDEIQLSMEGPRIRFNETETGTAKMGFTNRMNLVMQQSIKPYKTAAISFLVIFILVLSGAGFVIYNLSENLDNQKLLTEQLKESTKAQLTKYQAKSDSLSKNLQAYKKKSDSLLALKKGRVSYVEMIDPIKDKVLAISVERLQLRYNGKTYNYDLGDRVMCTGYMIRGGIFMTARHCIDSELTNNLVANYIENNGGKSTLFYKAESYDDNISLEFTNHDLKADYSMDKIVSRRIKSKSRYLNGRFRIPDYFHGADWAYMKTKFHEGVPFDKAFSKRLKAGTELLVLGYTYGTRYRADGNMEPYFSTAKVAQSGLHDGTIRITEAGFDGGNSGGPVFAINSKGDAIAVGIVTGKYRKSELTKNNDVVWVDSEIQVITPLGNFK